MHNMQNTGTHITYLEFFKRRTKVEITDLFISSSSGRCVGRARLCFNELVLNEKWESNEEY